MPFEKRVVGTLQSQSPSLGEYLGRTALVFRVSGSLPLDVSWSLFECLDVNQRCKLKSSRSTGELQMLTEIPVDVGGPRASLGIDQLWDEASVLFLLVAVFFTDLNRDGILFSGFESQLREKAEKRCGGSSHLAPDTAELISCCFCRVTADGVSSRPLGMFKVQGMQQCSGSSLMALWETLET